MDDRDALRSLAWLISEHPRLEEGASEVETLLRRLVLLGDVAALYELAIRIEDRDPVRGRALIERAIRLGVPEAMLHLAITLLQSNSATRSARQRAESLLRRAAARDKPIAWHWLGLKRDFYDGPGKWREAAGWYRRAADAGIVDAMVNYAVCVSRGLGVRRNPAAAERWLERASHLGDRDAKRRLTDLRRDLMRRRSR